LQGGAPFRGVARLSFPEAPAFIKALRAPALVRLGTLLLAAVFLGAGVAVIATAWPSGTMTAEQAAAAPDSTFSTAGTINRVWAEGAGGITHVRLAGAPDLDLRVSGNALSAFSQGDFIVVQGAKLGNQVEVHSARQADDPIDVSAPYLAAGAVLAALLAMDFLSRWSKGGLRLRLPLPRLKRAGAEGSEAKATEPASPAAKP
jgi:hypothetical protein